MHKSLEEYEDNMKGNMLDIEVRLHRHLEEFRDRWDKIV